MHAADTIAPSSDDARLQLAADGRLQHLLTLDGLDANTLTELLDAADALAVRPGEVAPRRQSLSQHTVALLFFESSTRTRASFDVAAQRTGAEVVTLDMGTSSRQKGETILDTVRTLHAMNVDAVVVRDGTPGVPAFIAENVDDTLHVINAGESNRSHPTQGLLDLLTIQQHKGRIAGLTVTIVGDIAHSRVARSAIAGLQTLGVGDLRLVAPASLAPDAGEFPGTRFCDNLHEGLQGSDVVMTLRIQRERIADLDDVPDVKDYAANFGITRERMRAAAADAIVMHPGPMNRDVEIESALADGTSSVIWHQVSNGVAVRMAVLERLLGSQSA